jgi:hypothetical protein
MAANDDRHSVRVARAAMVFPLFMVFLLGGLVFFRALCRYLSVAYRASFASPVFLRFSLKY